jgi:hypothetical protein
MDNEQLTINNGTMDKLNVLFSVDCPQLQELYAILHNSGCNFTKRL